MNQLNSTQWAAQEFGSADLGHQARTDCLIRVAQSLAERPAGRITSFCRTAADQQAAYGLVENEAVCPIEITRSAARAAISRGADSPYILTLIDGSSLALTDRTGDKGLGQVGAHASTKGLVVQSALALHASGTPLGIIAQKFWARAPSAGKDKKKSKDRRKLADKETQHALDVVQEAEDIAATQPGCPRLWFQMDRGYDCWPILQRMTESTSLYTVRGAYNRALWIDQDATADDEDDRYVLDALARSHVVGTLKVEVAANATRKARTATLSLRATSVDVRLKDQSRRLHKPDPHTGKDKRVAVTWPARVWVVQALEQDPPSDHEQLQWMLWTNHPIQSVHDAQLVVNNYALRWRIEEFHRLWKSGALQIEDSLLRAALHFERLARLAACVACRLLRLTYLARTDSQRPVAQEFSPIELEALDVLHRTSRSKRSPAPTPVANLTISQTVRLLADLGGYTGKSSGGPPGALVLSRGYKRLSEACDIIQRIHEIRDQW